MGIIPNGESLNLSKYDGCIRSELYEIIDQLTTERNEFMGYAKDGVVIAAQQQMEISLLTAERDALKAALEEIKLRSISLADAQVTALEALKGLK